MITTPEIKKIYASIQKQLFYLVPEKWEGIYLYASIAQQIFNLEAGELFFYYFPKGILKKNPINVYEIPNRFNLNEDEYIKLVENLYHTIKELWILCKDCGQRVWTNITIELADLKFKIEFNYEELNMSPYSNIERHIIWKYQHLNIPFDSFNKKEKKLIQRYSAENMYRDNTLTDVYVESIYKRPVRNIIDYNRQQEAPREKYITESESKKLEEKAKKRFEEQRYTYTKKQKKGLRKSAKEEKNKKEVTYIEQIEAQKKAVKSQILNHL